MVRKRMLRRVGSNRECLPYEDHMIALSFLVHEFALRLHHAALRHPHINMLCFAEDKTKLLQESDFLHLSPGIAPCQTRENILMDVGDCHTEVFRSCNIVVCRFLGPYRDGKETGIVGNLKGPFRGHDVVPMRTIARDESYVRHERLPGRASFGNIHMKIITESRTRTPRNTHHSCSPQCLPPKLDERDVDRRCRVGHGASTGGTAADSVFDRS